MNFKDLIHTGTSLQKHRGRFAVSLGICAVTAVALAAFIQPTAIGAAVGDHSKGKKNYVQVQNQVQSQQQLRPGDGGPGGLGAAKIIWIKVKHRGGGQAPIVYFETDTLLNISNTSTPNLQKHFFFEHTTPWYSCVDTSMVFGQKSVDFQLINPSSPVTDTHPMDDNGSNSITVTHFKVQNVVFVP